MISVMKGPSPHGTMSPVVGKEAGGDAVLECCVPAARLLARARDNRQCTPYNYDAVDLLHMRGPLVAPRPGDLTPRKIDL